MLERKYPKCKGSVAKDFSDFYEHIVTKHLEKLKDPKGYLYQFIFNRYYRYFQRVELLKFLPILPDAPEEVQGDNKILDIAEGAIASLGLDDRRLYDYYFVQGLSGRAIGRKLKISHTGVHTQLNALKAKIKKQICLQLSLLD